MITSLLAQRCCTYLRTGLTVILFTVASVLYATAQPELKGRVTDSLGEPIPGVTVLVRGTQDVVITDLDGNYSIKAPAGATVEFICLGMVTENIKWDGKKSIINVSMTEDKTLLEETVIVGYGKQKKSSLTSAVSAMKGDELLKAPSTNVSQLLAGRLPGLSSVQESGEPGLDQAALRIRGSQNAVAYVVDGFPVDNINEIDPNDIESISVLKDGASAAVYGLRASGGVIIVTTKKGTKGAAKISYNASFGASINANFPEFMDGPEFAYYYNVADMMDKMASGKIASEKEYVPYFTKEQVQMMLNDDPTDGWDNVDYIGKIFGTGFTQKHNVTVQGGSDNVHYFTSFGYLGQNGNIDNYNYNRYNLRANIDATLAKHFDFSIGLSGVLGDRKTPGFGTGGSDKGLGYEAGWLSIVSQTLQMHPYLPEKYEGLYTASIKTNTGLAQSPLAAIYDSGYKKTNSSAVSVNASLAYNAPFLKGLRFRVSGAFDYKTSYNKNLNTPFEVMAYHQGSWSKKSDPRGNGNGINLGEGSTYSSSYTFQGDISYDGTFGKNHLNLLALAELRGWKGNSLAAYAKKLPFASLPELGNGVPTDKPISGSSNASRSMGYVFRVRYDYDEKYLAEFTGRCDGSYKFAGMNNTRWGFFPSASIGWRMSKENWMKDIKAVSDLKIRASVGLLGNDNASAYTFLSTYGKIGSDVIYNGKNFPAYQPLAVPNKDLTWEKTLSWNVGFDLSMWNGMLGIELDGFYNKTYDMLTSQGANFPPSMGGYYPTIINKNAMEAKGVDIMLSHRHKVMAGGKPFIYGLGFSITYAKTRWLIYPDRPDAPEIQKLTGKPVGTFLAWQADGLYRTEEEIDNSAWYGTRPCLGDIKYVDVNGDGKIDSYDKGLIGRPNRPELTFGLNFDFAWNGFDFNAQFTGGALFDVSLTGTYYNGNDDNTIWTKTFRAGANSPLYLVQNAYSIYNPEGTFPRITLGDPGHGGANGLASSFWIRDGKYLRLKSAQLGYTLPRKIMSKAKIETLRFFIEGQNIFTIDGLPQGIDPESPGVNNGYYPQQCLLMGGVTLTF